MTLTNLYVDFYGTILDTNIPSPLLYHNNHLNATQSSSFAYLSTVCHDPTAEYFDMDVIIGKLRLFDFVIDSNRITTTVRKVIPWRLGGPLAFGGPQNFTLSNNYISTYVETTATNPIVSVS